MAGAPMAHPLSYEQDPFRQLDEVLPDPNGVRSPTGAPGPEYWQQRADYQIAVRLDDENQRLTGSQVSVNPPGAAPPEDGPPAA